MLGFLTENIPKVMAGLLPFLAGHQFSPVLPVSVASPAAPHGGM